MISLHSPAFCTTVLFCHVLSYLPLSYPTLSYTILFSSYCPILFNLLVRHALCNIRELNTPYLLVSSHYISHLIRSSLCVSHYAGLFVSLSLSLSFCPLISLFLIASFTVTLFLSLRVWVILIGTACPYKRTWQT